MRGTEVPTILYSLGSLARASGATFISQPSPVAVIFRLKRLPPMSSP